MSSPQVGDVVTTADEWEALPENALAVSWDGRAFFTHGVWRVIGPHAPLTLVYLPGQPPRPERVVKAEALREYALEMRAWGVQGITDFLLDLRADRIERGEP